MSDLESIVLRIQGGDDNLLPLLWQSVERFVIWQAQRRLNLTGLCGGCDLDDLVQSSYEALLEAVRLFDPTRGSFLTLLGYRLRIAFSKAQGIYHRRRDPLDMADSFDRVVLDNGGDDAALTLADTLADDSASETLEAVEAEVWNAELRRALENALSRIPAQQAEIIRAHYFEGRTLPELAAERGVKASALRDRERTALRAMGRTPRLASFIEMQTPYYSHVGLNAFLQTQESSVERAVFKREALRRGDHGK